MDRHNIEEVRSFFGGYIPTDREGFFKYGCRGCAFSTQRWVL